MAAVAGKYLIKNEVVARAGRQEQEEATAYVVNAGVAPHMQQSGGRPPPKLLDCNGLPKTYGNKGVKESKELKAHRKKLLQAFTLKQPRNGATQDIMAEYSIQPEHAAHNFLTNSASSNKVATSTQKRRRKAEAVSPIHVE